MGGQWCQLTARATRARYLEPKQVDHADGTRLVLRTLTRGRLGAPEGVKNLLRLLPVGMRRTTCEACGYTAFLTKTGLEPLWFMIALEGRV